MNNILLLAVAACFLALPLRAMAVETKEISEEQGIIQNTELCQSFAEYAVISKDLLEDGSLTESDVEILSAQFVVQTDDFRSLSEDRKDAWIEFMSNASSWAYKNKDSVDFYNQAHAYCNFLVSEAKKRVRINALRCQSVANLVSSIEPIYSVTKDKEITIDMLDQRIGGDKEKMNLLRNAVELIEEGQKTGADDVTIYAYQKCLTK